VVLEGRRSNGAGIGDYYQAAERAMREKIAGADDEYILNVDAEDFADYLVSQYDLPILIVRDDAIGMEQARDGLAMS
jgi:hypothetical protein